jgi:hypothetical protein
MFSEIADLITGEINGTLCKMVYGMFSTILIILWAIQKYSLIIYI